MPFVDVHHAVAPIHFHDGSDQCDDAVANFLYVRALVHCEPVRKLHQCGRRASFRRVNCSGDVINGNSLRDDLVGFGVAQLQGARIGELRKLRAIFPKPFQIFLGRNCHGDHLASLFGRPDRENFHARTGLLQHAHVFVYIPRIRQNSRRASHIAKHRFRRGHVLRCRQIVHQRRSEKRLRRVLLHFRCVSLVHWLLRISAGSRLAISPHARRKKDAENEGHYKLRHVPRVHDISCDRKSADSNSIGRAKRSFAIQLFHSRGRNMMQIGEGMDSVSPVAVSLPVARSIRNSTIVLLF